MQSLLMLAIVTLAASPASAGTPRTRINKLLDAMEKVESGGRPHAVTNGGRNRGPLQMSSQQWRDASKTGKPQWNYRANVYDRTASREVMKRSWQRYAPEAYRRGDMETLAKLHHSKDGDRYWQKVQKKIR